MRAVPDAVASPTAACLTSAPFVLRDAVLGDVAATARLHVRELRVGLFPRLGPRFIARWHRAFVESPYGVALVAVGYGPDGREHLTGFLVGATDRRAFRRELLTRHRAALLRRGVLALALRPRTLAHFLGTRLWPYVRRLRAAEPAVLNGGAGHAAAVAELTAIAVVGGARRRGTGRRLVEVFLGRCAAAGSPWVELVTATGAGEAMAFYTRTGWAEAGQDVNRDGVPVQRFGRRPDLPEAR
jgi:GNAT superfamily N-acetyltransferase